MSIVTSPETVVVALTATSAVKVTSLPFDNAATNPSFVATSFINVEVSTSKDVLDALLDGKDITLKKDIVVDAKITLPENKDVTLNLNGHTYSTTQLNAGEVSQVSKYIKVPATSSLTIENGTFEGRGIMNNGDLIIKSDAIIAQDTYGGACI